MTHIFKQAMASLSSRLLRASVDRISGDLELMWKLRACMTSVSLIENSMQTAKACATRTEVMNLALSATQNHGFVCELGVYKGASINMLARTLAPEAVYGFDTFTGLPEYWRDGFPEGKFSLDRSKLKFEDNCVIYPGLFDDSLPKFLKDEQRTARLIHIDCDLYSSTKSALTLLAPRIQPGTVLVFDEYFNYFGWQHHEYRAFMEFLEANNYDCQYLSYNKVGQQAAMVITR